MLVFFGLFVFFFWNFGQNKFFSLTRRWTLKIDSFSSNVPKGTSERHLIKFAYFQKKTFPKSFCVARRLYQNGLVRAHCGLEYIRLNSAFCPLCFFKTLFRKALYLQRCRLDRQFFLQKTIVENTLGHSALGPVHFDE